MMVESNPHTTNRNNIEHSLAGFVPSITLCNAPANLARSSVAPAPSKRTCSHRTPRVTMGHSNTVPGSELYRPPPSMLPASGPLSPSQVQFFFEQGYVIVRSLLPPQLLKQMRDAIPAIETAKLQQVYDVISFRAWRSHSIARQIAVSSPVAAAAAQLTPVQPGSRGVIVINDAYFRLRGDNPGCGFHVDDPFFWPCPMDAPGPGVNAWIALDDVGEDGGGLTLAPRSHLSPFLDCREAIKENTCLLAELDPAKNDRLEAIGESPMLKAGDVILLTRWLFHRGNPFRKGSAGALGDGIARYSIRYMPAEATVREVLLRVVDGKPEFVRKDPVTLNDCDPEYFPAVHLE